MRSPLRYAATGFILGCAITGGTVALTRTAPVPVNLLVAAQPLVRSVPSTRVEIWFTPGDDVESKIVAAITAAKSTIHVQAYSFTSKPIGSALIAAKARGVDVRLILDRSNTTDPHSQAGACHLAGIAVLVDARHRIAHNKVVLCDDMLVIGGSYNYSHASNASNAENCPFIVSPAIAARYLANWTIHAAHSTPFVPLPIP